MFLCESCCPLHYYRMPWKGRCECCGEHGLTHDVPRHADMDYCPKCQRGNYRAVNEAFSEAR